MSGGKIVLCQGVWCKRFVYKVSGVNVFLCKICLV